MENMAKETDMVLLMYMVFIVSTHMIERMLTKFLIIVDLVHLNVRKNSIRISKVL